MNHPQEPDAPEHDAEAHDEKSVLGNPEAAGEPGGAKNNEIKRTLAMCVHGSCSQKFPVHSVRRSFGKARVGPSRSSLARSISRGNVAGSCAAMPF